MHYEVEELADRAQGDVLPADDPGRVEIEAICPDHAGTKDNGQEESETVARESW